MGHLWKYLHEDFWAEVTSHAAGRYNWSPRTSPVVFVHMKTVDVCILCAKQTDSERLPLPDEFRMAVLSFPHLTCAVDTGNYQYTNRISPKLPFAQVQVWQFCRMLFGFSGAPASFQIRYVVICHLSHHTLMMHWSTPILFWNIFSTSKLSSTIFLMQAWLEKVRRAE